MDRYNKKETIKSAVALEYDPSDEAPKIIATGKGVLAEKIIEKGVCGCHGKNKKQNVRFVCLHQDMFGEKQKGLCE